MKLSKELNILQAIEMPIGTEFEVIYEDGFEFEDKNIVKLDGVLTGKKLIWLNGDEAMCGSLFINAKFIPIQKPVTFMEAVKAYSKGKTVKCILKFEDGDSRETIYIKKIIGYMELKDSNDMCISYKEILEGEWYIQEGNAND